MKKPFGPCPTHFKEIARALEALGVGTFDELTVDQDRIEVAFNSQLVIWHPMAAALRQLIIAFIAVMEKRPGIANDLKPRFCPLCAFPQQTEHWIKDLAAAVAEEDRRRTGAGSA